MSNQFIVVVDIHGGRNIINLHEVVSVWEDKQKVNHITMTSGTVLYTATIGLDQLLQHLKEAVQ
jgi:hypothetical protein